MLTYRSDHHGRERRNALHDRMPVILATDAARRWLEPGPLPAELLMPYPASPMTAWRVSDDAKSSRIEPHAGMAEPVPD
jgi:putative SOS response-associated peptidase YedK